MNVWQRMVGMFHAAMGQPIGQTPEIRDAELRAKLVLEEALELVAALTGARSADIVHNVVTAWLATPSQRTSLVEAIDAMCDLQYVTLGTAVACGVDLDPFFGEVHRTNMLKSTGEVRADGKRLKPLGWQPPRIALMLAQEIDKTERREPVTVTYTRVAASEYEAQWTEAAAARRAQLEAGCHPDGFGGSDYELQKPSGYFPPPREYDDPRESDDE